MYRKRILSWLIDKMLYKQCVNFKALVVVWGWYLWYSSQHHNIVGGINEFGFVDCNCVGVAVAIALTIIKIEYLYRQEIKKMNEKKKKKQVAKKQTKEQLKGPSKKLLLFIYFH